MKKIVIPTDFSEISKNSVLYGCNLAIQLNMEVKLVHVLELYKFAAGTSETEILSTILPAESITEMENAAKESFKKLTDELTQIFGTNLRFTTVIIPGHLVNDMIAESADEDTELIIMAVAENKDLMTRFNNSTISTIIAEASSPILVIPSTYKYSEIQRAIYATDFNKGDVDALLHYISQFCTSDPEITVVHISIKPIDFKTELRFAGFKQLIKEKTSYPNINFKMYQTKNVVSGLLEAIKEQNADMLVMFKEHEGFFKSLFETSKTEKITHYLKIPMLSYHAAQKSGKI